MNLIGWRYATAASFAVVGMILIGLLAPNMPFFYWLIVAIPIALILYSLAPIVTPTIED
jgi:hypothetical protein